MERDPETHLGTRRVILVWIKQKCCYSGQKANFMFLNTTFSFHLCLLFPSDAKTNIRDYHGRTAAHYWSGCKDVFEKQDAQSGEKQSFE